MAQMNEPRPGPSKDSADPSDVSPDLVTGNPVTDTANTLGSIGETYEEEYRKLKNHLITNGNVLGPSAPVIFVDLVRQLYRQAQRIVASSNFSPYEKSVSLFHIFDTIVLAYKNLAFVYCDSGGARSVYGYSESALKTLLSRVEAIARQVAVTVHDAYSLTVLNNVVSGTEQKLSQVQSEKDMLAFFRGISGVSQSLPEEGVKFPNGVEIYKDSHPEAATLITRLNAFNSDKTYIRDFYDAVFLIATANSPATLSSALETRLANKDRNVLLLDVPGDRMFGMSLCSSAIAFLRKRLTNPSGSDEFATRPTRKDEIETYRINYSRVFSKYRGESERNFDTMMEWIKNTVRGGDKFRVFWFPDIENLMSPRTSNDQEHIATIKNSMLQHMDVFNKDPTMRSFLLLFSSAEGNLDSAFARRLETIVSTPPEPLRDLSVSTQVVGAELARYHINVSESLATRIATQAGNVSQQNEQHQASTTVGGFAYIQAALRELYVNQKLALRYDAGMVDIKRMSAEALVTLMGRYTSGVSTLDTLYDLDERPLLFGSVSSVAFSHSSRLAVMFSKTGYRSIKYNADIRGDPKNIDDLTAARTVFLHDL